MPFVPFVLRCLRSSYHSHLHNIANTKFTTFSLQLKRTMCHAKAATLKEVQEAAFDLLNTIEAGGVGIIVTFVLYTNARQINLLLWQADHIYWTIHN